VDRKGHIASSPPAQAITSEGVRQGKAIPQRSGSGELWLAEVISEAKRNDARAPKAIFPLLFAFAEIYKPA
jgi:hypothetical protein